MLGLPITQNAKRFGYITWTMKDNEKVKQLLSNNTSINLEYMGANHGEKRIDWKYRRISVGKKWTNMLPENVTEWVFNYDKKLNRLQITCR